MQLSALVALSFVGLPGSALFRKLVDDDAQNLLGVGCLVQFLFRFLGFGRYVILTVFNVVSSYLICRALLHVPDQRHPLELQFVVQAPPLSGLQQLGW